MGTYRLRVPASRVVYVPDAQGGLPPRAPRTVCCTYWVRVPASAVPYVRTAYCGNPGHRPLRAGHGGWPLRSVRGRPLEPARPPPICAPADPVPCVVPLPVRPSPRWRATPRTSSSCSRRRRRPSNPYPNADPNPHPHPHPSRSWECSTARSSRPTTAPTPTRCCHATPPTLRSMPPCPAT